MTLREMGAAARKAAAVLANAGAQKDEALLHIAAALEAWQEALLAANAEDLRTAEKNGMRASLLDRLRLTPARIAGMAQGVREVAAQKDPIGEVIEGGVRPNGLLVRRVRVPLGVVGIIFEARPNVTSDAAALCLKAGNAVLLRGGKEAIHSNAACVALM